MEMPRNWSENSRLLSALGFDHVDISDSSLIRNLRWNQISIARLWRELADLDVTLANRNTRLSRLMASIEARAAQGRDTDLSPDTPLRERPTAYVLRKAVSVTRRIGRLKDQKKAIQARLNVMSERQLDLSLEATRRFLPPGEDRALVGKFERDGAYSLEISVGDGDAPTARLIRLGVCDRS